MIFYATIVCPLGCICGRQVSQKNNFMVSWRPVVTMITIIVKAWAENIQTNEPVKPNLISCLLEAASLNQKMEISTYFDFMGKS